MLKVKLKELEEKFFLADAQFEQTMAATRKEFDTTLKVRLDTLRAELTREKDAAILSLKQAQDSQLEELKEYYTSRYASKVSEMQKLIDAKDAKIEELEAALGDPLSLWWTPVWKSNFYGAFGDACSMAWRCQFLTARPSQDGRAIADAPDELIDFHTGGSASRAKKKRTQSNKSRRRRSRRRICTPPSFAVV